MYRRLALIPIVAVSALAVSCGGDDEPSATGAFCDAVLDLNDTEVDVAGDDDAPDLGVAGFERLASEAPAAVVADTERMVEILRQLTVLAEDPDLATDVALPLLDEFEVAAGRVAEFAQDNCPDLPPEIFSS